MVDTSSGAGESLRGMIQDVLVRTERLKPIPGGSPFDRNFSSDFDKGFSDDFGSESYSEGDFQPSGMDRLFSSRFGSEAASLIGNESRTLAAINHLSGELIAQSLRIGGRVLPDDRILISTSAPSGFVEEARPVVVVLSDQEHSLNGALQSDNFEITSDLVERALYSGGDRVLSRQSDASSAVVEASPEIAVLVQAMQSGRAVVDLMQISRPEVISFPKPEMIDLCAPFPALRIEKGNDVSSSGILCRNQDGELGLTACHHGTGPAGTKVSIDGVEYQVTLDDRVQDLVFIPVDDTFLNLAQRGLAGLRQKEDLAPAKDEEFSFDGVVNADQETYGQSCDSWLFNLDPHVQLRMQTTRDTDQGDSGSALIDRNGKLVAFAFRMTKYGARPGFTDWIWAPNALDALGLIPELP